MAVEPVVHRPAGEVIQRPFHVLAEGVGQAVLQLGERGREVGVVLVGIARHEAGSQEHGHRLRQRQAQRRQERPLLHAPPAALAPERDLHLVLERVQVPVDVPHGHVRAAGDLGRPDAGLAVPLEHAQHAEQTGEPVALALQAFAVRQVVVRSVVGHGTSLLVIAWVAPR